MKLKRERDAYATSTNPKSRGGLLPLHHGNGGEVVGKDGDHAGSALPEFSPSNLQLQVYVSWFLCFGGAPSRKALGDYFYSRFLGQDGGSGKKIDMHQHPQA